jgi:hypothetical protein
MGYMMMQTQEDGMIESPELAAGFTQTDLPTCTR